MVFTFTVCNKDLWWHTTLLDTSAQKVSSLLREEKKKDITIIRLYSDKMN